MAQNEGRTLRRAPKSVFFHGVTLLGMVVAATLFGLAVHSVRVAAEARFTTKTAQTAAPTTNSGTVAADQTAAQGLQVNPQPATVQVSQTTRDCVRGSYTLPTTINLASLPTGLTTIQDSPQRYTIYGNTVAEQMAQLQRCAPVDEFAGAASYQISWMYGYSVRGDGLCEIVQPKIGLHLNMVLPVWVAGNGAAGSARTAWQAFSAGLMTHESGHYAISKQYAATMLNQLQHFSPQSCATIETAADGAIASKLKQLEAAQNNYDAATNHGASQGAAL